MLITTVNHHARNTSDYNPCFLVLLQAEFEMQTFQITLEKGHVYTASD